MTISQELVHGALKKPNVSDYEVIRNVYTFVNYYYEENKFVMGVYCDPELIDTSNILKLCNKMFEPIINTRFNGNRPSFEIIYLNVDNFKKIYEDCTTYSVGYNYLKYDMLIISFIYSYILEYQTMPPPEIVRQVSDLIIKPKQALEIWSELRYAAMRLRLDYILGSGKRIYIITLLLHIDSIMHQYKRTKQTSIWLDCYNKFMFSNKYIDVMVLLGNDKDNDSGLIGLKRVAAQEGFQVVEPKDGIDLSNSELNITRDQLTTLLVYNTSDTYVTYLEYIGTPIQDQIKIREKLLTDYNDRFENVEHINSTNAKLLTTYVAPINKLKDFEDINYWFPVYDPEHASVIEWISDNYPKKETYHPRYVGDTMLNQMTEADEQMTITLRQDFRYKASDKTGYERFRVHYGRLEKDLLEHMYEKHPKFPKSAYDYYNICRFQKDKQKAFDAFVEKYPVPPKDFVYEKKKNKYSGETITAIKCQFIIEGTEINISCSNGGVHGEVIFLEKYNTTLSAIDWYNRVLNLLKELYPNPNDLRDFILQNGSKKDISEYDLGIVDLSGFLTKIDKLKSVNYKKEVTPPNHNAFKKIVDLINIAHADVTSLYPTIILILKIFSEWSEETLSWVDPYLDQYDYRIAAKHIMQAVDECDWTEKEIEANTVQESAKLFLNNGSGAIDTSTPSNVQMPRKANSMRADGQLILLDFVFTIAENDGESVSTNTDGVYLNNIEYELAETLVLEWTQRYNIEAIPEKVDRFISKDSNNRYEVLHNASSWASSGGTLGNAKKYKFNKKWTQPAIIDKTLVEYFKTHTDVPNTDYSEIDVTFIRNYLINQHKKILSNKTSDSEKLNLVIGFCHSLQATKGAYYFKKTPTGHIESLPKIIRVVFTKTGYVLKSGTIAKQSKAKVPKIHLPNAEEQQMARSLELENILDANAINIMKTGKIQDYTDQLCLELNQDLTTVLDHPVWFDLNIEAYVDIAVSKLKLWNNNQEKRLQDQKISTVSKIKSLQL